MNGFASSSNCRSQEYDALQEPEYRHAVLPPATRHKLLAQFSAALLIALLFKPLAADAQGRVQLPHTGLTPHELALIINDEDQLSRQIGDYYQKARQIPAANVIYLPFPPGRTTLSKDEFPQVKAENANHPR